MSWLSVKYPQESQLLTILFKWREMQPSSHDVLFQHRVTKKVWKQYLNNLGSHGYLWGKAVYSVPVEHSFFCQFSAKTSTMRTWLLYHICYFSGKVYQGLFSFASHYYKSRLSEVKVLSLCLFFSTHIISTMETKFRNGSSSLDYSSKNSYIRNRNIWTLSHSPFLIL